MHDILKFDSVDVSCTCMTRRFDFLTVIPQDEVVPHGIPFMSKYENPSHQEKLPKWDAFWEYYSKQLLPFMEIWNIYALMGT